MSHRRGGRARPPRRRWSAVVLANGRWPSDGSLGLEFADALPGRIDTGVGGGGGSVHTGETLGVGLRALLELVGMLLTALLRGLDRGLRGIAGPVHRDLGGLLGDLLAVLEGLLPGLLDPVLHVVGELTHALVLDAG